MVDLLDLNIEKYQDPNGGGLFPAAINSKNKCMNEFFWIRDNYYVYQAVNQKSKKKIIHAFQNIVDYLKHLEKFDYKPTEDWMYIHPRYDKNLNEIPGEWGWVQNDCAGNLLEILSEAEDKIRTKILVNYLEDIKYWECPDFGFWEEGPKEVRSSSLASCIRGLKTYSRKIQKSKKPSKNINGLIDKGYKSLNSLLPGETESRRFDLALLSLIYPKQIVGDYMKEIIMINTKRILKAPWGFKRYLGDTWNGEENNLKFGKEMGWTMGLPWMYLITKNPKYLLEATKIKQRYKTMPEGILNGWPNCTPCLVWAEAMYKLAIDDFKKNQK